MVSTYLHSTSGSTAKISTERSLELPLFWYRLDARSKRATRLLEISFLVRNMQRCRRVGYHVLGFCYETETTMRAAIGRAKMNILYWKRAETTGDGLQELGHFRVRPESRSTRCFGGFWRRTNEVDGLAVVATVY